MNQNSEQAVVVLGAAVWPNEEPSPTLLRRAELGAKVQRQQNCLIIGSGGLGKFPPSEAEVMKRIFIENQVPSERIILESRSKTTLENLQYSSILGSGFGIQKYVIVTDFYHVFRVRLTAYFLNLNCEVVTAKDTSGTNIGKIVKSVLRETIALPFYTAKLIAVKFF